jgi:YhcN/YlaJ family sporulation lipoprotein
MKKCVPFLLVTALLGSACLYGCQSSNQPMRKPALNTPAPRTKTTPAPSATSASAISDKCASQAATVSGVRSATVVISANTAYCGLTLNSGVSKSRTDAIKREVATKIKQAQPSLVTVSVTSDPNLVQRLRKVADGIKAGRPVSSFTSELAEIARRITPTMK